MKSDVIIVSGQERSIEAALAQAEKVAAYKELSKKGALHLRLLTEEMMALVRSVAGEVEGKFWIEDEDGEYQLHLQAQTNMNEKKRERLLSASSSGQNEASRGIMGKLRVFFSSDDDLPLFFSPSMSDGPDRISDMNWSMYAYRELLEQYITEHRDGAQEAWDELEKSVVSHVADDVKVSIRGRKVEMTIIKKLA